MSVEEDNKALIKRMYEFSNTRDMDSIATLLDPACIFHMPGGDLDVAQERQFEEMFWAAFPDITITILDIIGEGDMIAYRVGGRGTHQGPFMGHAATGKKLDLINSNWVRIRDGKCMEFWVTSDRLSIMQQLGLITDNI